MEAFNATLRDVVTTIERLNETYMLTAETGIHISRNARYWYYTIRKGANNNINIIQPSVVLAPSETTMTPPPPGACDGTGALLIEDEPKGYIVPTGHPRDYLNNQVCEWVLKADENEIIQLTFLEFDLEDG